MKSFVLLASLAFVAVTVWGAAVPDGPREPQRIIGGSPTTIHDYPYSVAILIPAGGGVAYWQWCGGTIITTRTILSVAHCYHPSLTTVAPNAWRARVGSTYAHSGGVVHNIDRIINHEDFWSTDFDISVLRTSEIIEFITGTVAAAPIAGVNYDAGDNTPVTAIGWGATEFLASSEELRQVEVFTINQELCHSRYQRITDRMLCTGILDVGGKDQCQGDSGSPVIHQGVVIGICSWGYGCADSFYPGVNTRVSAFTEWIVNASNEIQME